jgi:hypothetical protein
MYAVVRQDGGSDLGGVCNEMEEQISNVFEQQLALRGAWICFFRP